MLPAVDNVKLHHYITVDAKKSEGDQKWQEK